MSAPKFDFAKMRACIYSYLSKIGGNRFDENLKKAIVYDFIRSGYKNTSYFCKYMNLSRATFYRWLDEYGKDADKSLSVESLDNSTDDGWNDPEELTPSEEQAIKEALEGKPLYEVAEKYKLKLRNLRNLAVKHGWNKECTKWKGFQERQSRNEEMLNLRKEGKTLEEIGKKFNISRERVRQLIDNDGSINKELRKQREAENELKENKKARVQFSKHLAETHRKLKFMEAWNNLPKEEGVEALNKLCSQFGYSSYLSASVSINKMRSQGFPFLLRWEHTASELNKQSMQDCWNAYKSVMSKRREDQSDNL